MRFYGEWNPSIENNKYVKSLITAPPWPLTQTIKLNSPLGFLDCLCFGVARRLFPSHHFHARLEKWDQYVFVFDVLNKRRHDAALNRGDLYTGGHRALITFPNIERLDGKYFIRRRVDKWLASIVSAVVDWFADGASGGIDRLFMSIWWEMNWLCGASFARHVGAAAHNHVGGDWQAAVFSQQCGESAFKKGLVCFRLHLSNCWMCWRHEATRPSDWTAGLGQIHSHLNWNPNVNLFGVNHFWIIDMLFLCLLDVIWLGANGYNGLFSFSSSKVSICCNFCILWWPHLVIPSWTDHVIRDPINEV